MNPYLEIILRSIAVYAFVIICIRLFGKKELAQLSIIDLVFILLISNSVQNAMVGPDTSLLGGVTAATALFLTNFILKKMLYNSKKFSEVLQGKSILLVYNGILQTHNLASAEITFEEIQAAVREHGIQDIQHVRLAMLEVDGNISVVSGDFDNVTTHSVKSKQKFRGRVTKN